MADGTLRQQPDTITSKAFSDLKAVLPDKSLLPPLPIAHLNLIVAEAVWDYDMHEQPHHSKQFKRQFRKLLSKVYHKFLYKKCCQHVTGTFIPATADSSFMLPLSGK